MAIPWQRLKSRNSLAKEEEPQDHYIPLTDQAIAQLLKLQKIAMEKKPQAKTLSTFDSKAIAHAMRRINNGKRLTFKTDFTPHNTRHTISTRMTDDLGVQYLQLEASLEFLFSLRCLQNIGFPKTVVKYSTFAWYRHKKQFFTFTPILYAFSASPINISLIP